MNFFLLNRISCGISKVFTSKMSTAISKTRLAGKIAIVTASTDGIGFAIAERLAQEGAKVIISSRKQKNVDTALQKLKSQGLDVIGLICHVSKGQDRKKLFDEVAKLGGLDILVSNAGTNPSIASVLDCEEAVWDKVFEINVKSSFLLAKEALPLLRKRGKGKIVFVSSIAGFQPFNYLGAYSVSKTALIGLTKAASAQLAQEHITVNCVAPGIIKTKFSAQLTSADTGKGTMSLIPMQRFGDPKDICGVVAFLVSSDADYITGETIVAAGGMHSRL